MMRVGIIGLGNIATVHLRYLAAQPDVRITAICDIELSALERRQREFGGTPYRDFQAMLAHEQLDAVWLCTPPQVRYEPLLACADRHIPVFCEKPVARDLQEAHRIARDLAAHRARVMVGYVFRSLPIIQHLRSHLANDRVHAAYSFYACPMSIERSMPAWFFDKSLSGGALIDQATHNFDLLRFLLGEVDFVTGVAANPVSPKTPGYTIDETIALILHFTSCVVVTHLHSWLADSWRNELLLSGQRHAYRLNLFAGTLSVESARGSKQSSFPPERLYEFENEHFLNMLRSGDWSANPCTFDDGLRTLELTLRCDAALSSLPCT